METKAHCPTPTLHSLQKSPPMHTLHAPGNLATKMLLKCPKGAQKETYSLCWLME